MMWLERYKEHGWKGFSIVLVIIGVLGLLPMVTFIPYVTAIGFSSLKFLILPVLLGPVSWLVVAYGLSKGKVWALWLLAIPFGFMLLLAPFILATLAGV